MEEKMSREPELSPIPWTARDNAKGVAVVIAFLVVIMLLTTIATVMIAFALLGSEAFLELGPDGVRDYIASDDFTKYLVIVGLVGTLVLEGAILFTVWRFSMAKYRCGWGTLGFRHVKLRDALRLALVVLGACVLVNLLYAVVVSLLGAESLEPTPLPFDYDPHGASLALLAVLSLIIAPFAEETFFRGFLFTGLGKRFGYSWGAVLSAMLFALAHLQMAALVPIFVLGLLLAWLYARTGSLWPCIFTHLVYNSIALVFVI